MITFWIIVVLALLSFIFLFFGTFRDAGYLTNFRDGIQGMEAVQKNIFGYKRVVK
ncbi:MAG: hypothetical protein ACXABY_27795 [Candidatus Thorarchaeota archaeon]